MSSSSKNGRVRTGLTERRELRVPITEALVAAKGKDMAKLRAECAAITMAAKHAAKDFREQVKDLEERISELANDVTTNTEERSVECYVVHNYSEDIVQLYRADTDVLVEERELTDEDRQAPLFNAETAAKAAKSAPSRKRKAKPRARKDS
jgi:hypothetical protein